MMLFGVSLPFVSVLLFSVVQYSECRTYHLALLGRKTLTSKVGSIVATTSGQGHPTFSITHGSPECMYSTRKEMDGVTTILTLHQNISASCSPIVPNNTEISSTGLKIETENPDYELHVYQTDSNGLEGDGFLAIPDDYLGNAYYVITYCSMGGVCQFAVTAVNNNTAVNVVLPRNVTNTLTCINGFPIPDTAPSGSKVPIVLQEFQVLHVESSEDLSGTYIVADKDVSVIVGARDVPDNADGETNMIEQVPPVDRWGSEFVVAPNYYNTAGDLVKIVSKTDNTVVHIQGFSPLIMSNKGDVIDRRIDWELHSRILTSHPVLVMQIMSIDLYNNTSNVHGSPSMVMVPHVYQWTVKMDYYCLYSNDPMMTMVAESSTTVTIPVLPQPTILNGWTTIPVSKYSVLTFIPVANETRIDGPKRAAYAHCDKRASVLLAADWTYTNQECELTLPSPGDGRDNDCDGEIDEDICQPDFTFVTEQSTTGTIPYKTVIIRETNHLHIDVQTCHIAMVKLQSTLDPEKDFTLHISPMALDNLGTSTYLYNITDCTVTHTYFLQWYEESGTMIHKLTSDKDDTATWNIANSYGTEYDTMVLSAMIGRAEFHINLYQTDCKFDTDSPDDFGSRFVVPVKNTDVNFTMYIVTGSEQCTVEFSVPYGPLEMAANTTKTMSYKDFTAFSNGITITTTDCEISVYMQREIVQGSTVFTRILPVDILGPEYLLYIDLGATGTPTNQTICEVWPVFENYLVTSDLFNLTSGDVGLIQYTDYEDLNIQHRFESDQAVAVFCGNFDETFVQMPPLSALGTKFYIPKLNLTLLNADAYIHLMSSEDSTVVIIKGDYDNLDPVYYTGDNHSRSVVSDTMYDIQSTKPIQVHLKIDSVSDNWASVIIIPPASQYKNVHVFPGLDSSYSITSSTAVDNQGNAVSSHVASGEPPAIDGTSKQLVYQTPTFTLTFANKPTTGSSGDEMLVIASDAFYNVTNEVCVVTKGTPGDLIDNDCDGLTDEENCSAIVYPGYTDVDIDGSMEEDCAANTTSTVETTLPIPNDVPECVTDYTPDPEVVKEITVGDTHLTTYANAPPVLPQDTEPTFEPVELPPSVLIMTTPQPPGVTSAPEEICETICPCGWLYAPQNYTIAELQEVVEKIQEKLKVSKVALSSTKRKKTSAPDQRTSAQAVGFVGLGFMIMFIGLIIVLDAATLMREIKTFFTNIRGICMRN